MRHLYTYSGNRRFDKPASRHIRAFSARQKIPMSMVWQERLLACRHALQDKRARSVSQVAMEFGFKDLSHFSRAFRQAFGYAPSSLLKQEIVFP